MTQTGNQLSIEMWNSGFYCGESVLAAIAEAAGVQSELIPKIASGFCSGVAETGGMCGAVSGAIMGISMLAGRSSPEDTIDPVYEKVRALLAEFEDQFGSVTCGELLGVDLATEGGHAAYQAQGLHQRCQGFVGEATSLALNLLDIVG